MLLGAGIAVAAWPGQTYQPTRLLVLLLNCAFAWVALMWVGLFNGLLLLGGWLMVVHTVFRWLRADSPVLAVLPLLMLNVGITLAIVAAKPDISGVSLRLAGLESSTVFGVYRQDEREFKQAERSQAFRRGSTARLQITLQYPQAGRQNAPVRLLVKPNQRSTLRIESLALLSYVGFDARTRAVFEGADLAQLVRTDAPVQLEHNQLIVGPIDNPLWISLPTGTIPVKVNGEAAWKVALRGLLYWQLAFFVCLWLAPRRLGQPQTELIQHQPAGLPWWSWTSVLHLLFLVVLALVAYSGFAYNEFVYRLIPFSLAHEGNYAVWWSGIGLLFSGLLYYRLAGSATNNRDRFTWLCLAGVLFALSLDEVGSLHERVSLYGGWWALLPFAIAGLAAFGYAITRMLVASERRSSALLVLLSLLLFALVAGLEEIEFIKTIEVVVARSRFLVEEAMELLATSLLILSAAIQTGRGQNLPATRVHLGVPAAPLPFFANILFLALALHLAITMIWMPYLWFDGMGEPAYWLPMTTFALLAFHCLDLGRQGSRHGWIAWLGAATLLLLSMGQLYNHGELISMWLPAFPESLWQSASARILCTLTPLLFWATFVLPRKQQVSLVLVVLVTLLVLRNGWHLPETYYMFSGFISASALLLGLSSTDTARRGRA